MDLAQAKDYWRMGIITDVLVKAPCKDRVNAGAGWTIEFLSERDMLADATLRIARKDQYGRRQAKEFAKLDSAARELASIGISQFRVIQDAG